MKKYILKRLLSAIPVLFIVSLLVFSILYLIPGDPAAMILGENATPEDIAILRDRMGLDQAFIPRYLNWLGHIFQGDFGVSVAQSIPVSTMIADRLRPTLSLSLYSMIIALVIAIPLGMLGARRKGTALDHAVSMIALLGISLPSFLLGLFLILIFAVRFRWFPVAGFVPISAGIGAHIRSITLPAIALGFMYSAMLMRMTRASLLETLSSGYVRMAKAKGVPEFSLVTKHAFRNALVPILAVAGQGFVGVLSGAAVVESLFAVPGIGSLVVNSIGRRDYQVIQAVVLLIALINVVINLAVDLLYGLVDPRIRLVNGEHE
ncbi:peptide ABC transporter [Spirochaetia bacterium]|nr:peptide ABC transporter [Spirochaetia bacterium]